MKVLIIRGGALGDTLMFLPALSVLPPDVEITFVGREPGLGFMGDHVDVCMDLERSGWHRLFQASPSGGRLPVEHADRVIAFFTDQSGDLGRNLKGFFPQSGVHTFPSFPPRSAALHVARYVARCLYRAGLPLDEDEAMENSLNGPLIKSSAPVENPYRVVFHPGSGDWEKNHPPQFWCRLMEALSGREGEGGCRHVLLLGPAETQLQPVFEQCLKGSGTEMMNCPSRERLMARLKSARFFIGHDSGVSHLSAMLGTPTLALFRTSDPVQWRPLGPSVQVITRSDSDDELLDVIMKKAACLLAREK
ncbi:MAG: glycosyltransferase family 9 protein [Deltaproteobacteria bacterium]|nr:glycosyltransferase family 9 protein [Deltaproteobacteria bacterium]